ncbi:PilW family protein, partial [Candidatus Omnitrophota bacterium]
MRRRKQKGFTLVELMISISILLILFSMLVIIFKATQESFIKATALQDVIDTSRVIIERMHNEISAAFFDPQGKASLVGLDDISGRLKTNSSGDELFFCTPITELESSDIAEVGYWLRDDGNVIRHYQA